MEKKIDIAELLKDCPRGMELYSPIYGVGVLTKVTDRIHVKFPKEHNVKCFRLDGKVSEDGEIMLYPKGKTTWEGFVPPCKFKDGDIIFTHANCLKVGVGNTWISIFKEKRNGGVATYVDYAEDRSDYYSDLDGDKALLCMESDILRQRFATEEEKEKLFQAIKANGYRWNEETKILEKLTKPKFKVGDTITNGKTSITIGYIDDEYYYEISRNIANRLFIKNQDGWNLVPNKFDINTLKPFDKVLVRLTNNCVWMPKLFSHYDTDSKIKYYPFVITDNIGYPQCIPYEKNEYLSNTTEDCDEYYKTWK